ncbi:hypothetical protein EZV62_026296 [Acer yangbiense]|uniref:Prephenate dehydratase domain-containing protein n=1 Tax=Acer yangbiense TaxID=1000413 RepID=A0A5C7GRT7_9ROSI|nr:hypothetical protein EZV62_026296 [Acer yangbiense]
MVRQNSDEEPSSSSSDGSKVRVAYQGIPGAYSEAAALKAYPKSETVPCEQFQAAFSEAAALKAYPKSETVPCEQFEAAFKAVELWLVNKAVLPIENFVGGSIHRNYDLLLWRRLQIVGEALVQCEMTLSKLGIIRVSAELLMILLVLLSGERDTGAVARARAAKIYGLNVLAEKIKFLPTSQEKNKSSAEFSLGYVAGKYFDYLLYINFEASMADPRSQFALRHLQEFSGFLCVLGSYSMDTGL